VVEEPVHIVHVKYPELVRRVENGRECRRRFVGGVMPDIVARHWRELRYDVRSGAQVGWLLFFFYAGAEKEHLLVFFPLRMILEQTLTTCCMLKYWIR